MTARVLTHIYWYGFGASFLLSFKHMENVADSDKLIVGLFAGVFSWAAVIAEIVERLT